MRQIITTARYEQHLEAHSFAIFTDDERLSDALPDEEVPACDCCGGTNHVREREVTFYDYDPEGWFQDTMSYDLCRDCYQLHDAVVRERAYEHHCRVTQQHLMFEREALQRYEELRARHAKDADWVVIVKEMSRRGVYIKLPWG